MSGGNYGGFVVRRGNYEFEISPEMRNPSPGFQQLMQARSSNLSPGAQPFVAQPAVATSHGQTPHYGSYPQINLPVRPAPQLSQQEWQELTRQLAAHFRGPYRYVFK
jgi:hypothetical protein